MNNMVSLELSPTKLRNMILKARENGAGGEKKTIGSCSIDVLDSKYDFGISAPPGEKMGKRHVARFPKF